MERKFIWIRHANKQYCNGEAPYGFHHHDSPIKEESEEDIIEKTISLVKIHGFPTKIIFSPFLRTRQTKDVMLQELKEIDKKKFTNIQTECDTDICEFLGFQKPSGIIADVQKETNSYFDTDITLGESLKHLNFRIKNHLTKLQLKDKKNEIVWIITHGLILNNIYYNLCKKNLSFRFSPLSHVEYTYSFYNERETIDYEL
jgi:broad specificity phosphatase PhoE